MNESTRNHELVKRISEGDESALDLLVRENIALVRSVVMHFLNRGVETEDLMQIGTIGIIKASRSFDLTRGYAFSTYAVPLIAGEIKRYPRDDGLIRVGRKTKSKAYEIMKAKENFIAENGREPKLSELAEICSLECEELVFTLGAANPPKSLSEPIQDREDMSLSDIIPSEDGGIDELTDKIALKEALESLSSDQRKILHLRFEKELSQMQTGRILGMTQVKVSREEKKIMTLLRKAL